MMAVYLNEIDIHGYFCLAIVVLTAAKFHPFCPSPIEPVRDANGYFERGTAQLCSCAEVVRKIIKPQGTNGVQLGSC
jgi:hypothetical protein